MEKKVQLVFQNDTDLGEKSVARSISPAKLMNLTASIDSILEWFQKFQIETIELWINGVAETDGVIKLFVNIKGEAGMKVTLKPK